MLLRDNPGEAKNAPRVAWRDRIPVALYAAAIVFPGVVSLGIKRKLLADEGGGFDLVAWALGLTDGTHLSRVQQLALYRWDFVIMFLLVPLGWLALVRWMGPRLRLSLTILAGVLASLVLFIELKTFWEVGTFLPLHVLSAGALGAGRKFASEYLKAGSVIKLAALMGGLVVASVVAYALETRRGALSGVPGWRASLAIVAAATIVVMLPLVPRTPFDRSAAVLALGEFAGLGSTNPGVLSNERLTSAELLRQYRGVSNAPVPNARSPYFGKAKGYNVLVYLYETLPFDCYYDSATVASYPALRSLEPTSFISERHYATYPYSRRAYFSIFSGWYPPHGMRDFTDESWENVSELGSPGMVRSAREAGYQTAAYVPERPETWESDLIRYRVLGFQRHVVPPNAGAVTDQLRQATEARRAWQRPQDDTTRAMLKRDIIRMAGEDKPWFVSFNPQISHGPWVDAASIASTADACARGADVMSEVDRGFGELLSLLDSLKQRDRTIIVALGDHGLRNRAEFPLFRGATLDDITFHVPMFISVPGVLTDSVRIPWVTSHIDIAPSVLDLLGIEQERELEQGSPMWNPALKDRRVFIFAQGYLGVDGYVEGDRAVMMNYMLRGVSESRGPRLEFSPRQLFQTPDSTSRAVTAMLWEVTKINHAFMQYLPALSAVAADTGAVRGGGGR